MVVSDIGNGNMSGNGNGNGNGKHSDSGNGEGASNGTNKSADASSASSAPQDITDKDITNQDITDYAVLQAFYTQNLTEHGSGHRATGWGNSTIQRHNFDLMCRIDGFDSGVSVLDVGCGQGDLLDFLAQQGIEVDYLGVDVCPEMVASARTKHPAHHFECRDIINDPLEESFDYVFCSGAMNLRLPHHEKWVEALITALYEHCIKGVATNFLSDYIAQDREEYQRNQKYFFAKPQAIFTLAQSLTRRVTINHSDNIETFQLYLYKQEETALDRHLTCTGLNPENQPYGEVAQSLFALACDLQEFDWANRFLDKFPQSDLAINAKIELLHGMQAFAQLAELCQAQLAQNGPQAHLFFALAMAQKHLDQKQNAFEHFEKALALEPESETFALNAIGLYIDLNHKEKAEQLLPVITTPELKHLLAGNIEHRLGDKKKAAQHYLESLRVNPEYTVAKRCLALIAQENRPTTND